MKRQNTLLGTAMLALLVAASPAFAQGRGAGAPPAGRGSSGGSSAGSPGAPTMGTSSRNSNGSSQSASGMSHSSPNEVLSHNTAIAGKINTLTGQNAETACGGFKNLGECVAAAHIAKNLDIPGGFDALKARVTGPNAVSLGDAVHGLNPNVNSKAEIKRAQKQANEDMKESGS
jgi:hypothetical protein